MSLECNNCGAPLPAPSGNQPFVACTYCQTITELPRRPPPVVPAPPPRPPEPIHVPDFSRSTQHSSKGPLFAILGLSIAAAAVSIAVALHQELRAPVPGGGAVAVAVPAAAPEPAVASIVQAVELPSETISRNGALPGSPQKSGTPAKKPAVKKASTTAPSATASAPPPPPVPKSLSVSMSSSLRAGVYSESTIQKRLAPVKGTVRSCYAKALEEKPELVNAEINMVYQIFAEGGPPRNIGALNARTPTTLNQCVLRAFLTVSFPPSSEPAGAANVSTLVRLSARF